MIGDTPTQCRHASSRGEATPCARALALGAAQGGPNSVGLDRFLSKPRAERRVHLPPLRDQPADLLSLVVPLRPATPHHAGESLSPPTPGASGDLDRLLVDDVLRLRRRFPRWGKDKLVLLLRRHYLGLSTSMAGRILTQLKKRGALREPCATEPDGHAATR